MRIAFTDSVCRHCTAHPTHYVLDVPWSIVDGYCDFHFSMCSKNNTQEMTKCARNQMQIATAKYDAGYIRDYQELVYRILTNDKKYLRLNKGSQ